jgi:excisionase family DNA binding protein
VGACWLARAGRAAPGSAARLDRGLARARGLALAAAATATCALGIAHDAFVRAGSGPLPPGRGGPPLGLVAASTLGKVGSQRKRMLRVAEAARLLGVNPPTLRAWERPGRLRSLRTPGGGRRMPDGEVRRRPGETADHPSTPGEAQGANSARGSSQDQRARGPGAGEDPGMAPLQGSPGGHPVGDGVAGATRPVQYPRGCSRRPRCQAPSTPGCAWPSTSQRSQSWTPCGEAGP